MFLRSRQYGLGGIRALGSRFSFFVPMAAKKTNPRLPCTIGLRLGHIDLRAAFVAINDGKEVPRADLLSYRDTHLFHDAVRGGSQRNGFVTSLDPPRSCEHSRRFRKFSRCDR